MVKACSRLGVVALALALVLVPAVARAHQRVDHRDSTRLSIRHSWLGVAPPTKANISPRPIVVALVVVDDPQLSRVSYPAPIAVEPAPNPVLDFSPDPLRGPPSLG